MKVLVTGASGFLGSHLCRKLKAQGDTVTEVSSKCADLTKSDTLAKFSKDKYDRIFHLAAWTQAGDFCLHHPGEQWVVNQQINTNVLAWWQAQQPQAKLIAIGTSCCYEPGKPHVEENFMRGDPTESLYTYAFTKRMLYAGLLALTKQFGLKHLFLVPSTLYGPDYHLDGRQMHFIFDLTRKIVEAKKNGTEVVLWGDGSQVRELIHVDDFINAALSLASSVDNEIVNLGGGRGHTIKEFAEILCKIVGVNPATIKYDTSKYVGAQEKVLVTEKLLKYLPNFKRTSLEDGLRGVVRWFEEAS